MAFEVARAIAAPVGQILGRLVNPRARGPRALEMSVDIGEIDEYRLRDGKETWLDYDRIFKVLRRVRFNGFVSLCYEGWSDQAAPHAVPVGVKFLRGFLTPFLIARRPGYLT